MLQDLTRSAHQIFFEQRPNDLGRNSGARVCRTWFSCTYYKRRSRNPADDTILLQDIPPSRSPINPRNSAGIQQGRVPSIYRSLEEFGGRGPGGDLAVPGHGEVQAPDSIRDIGSNDLDHHRNQGITFEVFSRTV